MTNEEEKTADVECERLLPGGIGLPHADAVTLFVSLAAPGDRLRIKVDRVQGKVSFASIIEILKPSAFRIEPPCPYFGRCGGCDFQQLTYEAQLQGKVEMIRDCLHRIANLEAPGGIHITPSANPWGYRARASWQVEAKEKLLGYFERGSNRVCDVEYCAVLAPQLEETLEQVRKELATRDVRQLRHVDVVVGDEGVSVAPSIAGFNPRTVSRRIGAEVYSFSADTFFQVNHELLEPLIDAALVDAKGQC